MSPQRKKIPKTDGQLIWTLVVAIGVALTALQQLVAPGNGFIARYETQVTTQSRGLASNPAPANLHAE